MIHAQCLTISEVQDSVTFDYARVAGSIVLVNEVLVVIGNEILPVACTTVVVGRVVPFSSIQDQETALFRWKARAFCVPKYRLDILEHHPALAGIEVAWVYGKARSMTGSIIAADFRVASSQMQARYAHLPAVKPDYRLRPANDLEHRRLAG